MAPQKRGQRGKGARVQGSEKEDAAQGSFLAYTDFQAPDHGEGETEDHEIDEEVGDAVPAVEFCQIDAGPVRDVLVPVVGDGRAFEDGRDKTDDEIADDDAFSADKEGAEPADYAEQAVVQENEGGLEGYGAAEVEYLYGQEHLFDNLESDSLAYDFGDCFAIRMGDVLFGRVYLLEFHLHSCVYWPSGTDGMKP